MNKLTAFSVLPLFIFFACKKDNTEPPKPVPQPDVVFADYAHLKPGNYWIYQIFDIDSSGNATATSRFDSVFAGPEQIISGKTYRVRMTPDGAGGYQGNYFRDSLHYQVDINGVILFSSADFKTIFRSHYYIGAPIAPAGDTVALINYQMTDRALTVSVPAGTFTSSTWCTTWYMYPTYAHMGSTRKIVQRYNIDIGIVSETTSWYFNTPGMQERRLIRYTVQ